MAGDQAMKRNQVLETLASTPRLRPVLSRASQLSQPISHFSFPHMPVLCCSTAQLCLTLCDPMDCTVHGLFQARILEWVAFPFSRGSPQPRDWTQVSCIVGRFFTSWATREAQEYSSGYSIPSPAVLPNWGTEPRYPELQVDSLPTELPGKPTNSIEKITKQCGKQGLRSHFSMTWFNQNFK